MTSQNIITDFDFDFDFDYQLILNYLIDLLNLQFAYFYFPILEVWVLKGVAIGLILTVMYYISVNYKTTKDKDKQEELLTDFLIQKAELKRIRKKQNSNMYEMKKKQQNYIDRYNRAQENARNKQQDQAASNVSRLKRELEKANADKQIYNGSDTINRCECKDPCTGGHLDSFNKCNSHFYGGVWGAFTAVSNVRAKVREYKPIYNIKTAAPGI
jgi:hypothetical protein